MFYAWKYLKGISNAEVAKDIPSVEMQMGCSEREITQNYFNCENI